MSSSIIEAESVLAIDVGSITTRALLLDVVEEEYRFISAGSAPSTGIAPYHDIGEGVHLAILNLQQILGRTLFSNEGNLIMPGKPNGAGVDRLVVNYSVGGDLRIVAVGLLTDVSLESALHLAGTTNAYVVEAVGLNDRQRSDSQLDAILLARPDLIIFTGGTENGATRSVFKLAELITMVCRLLPQEKRPEVLFAGNQAVGKKIAEVLQKWTPTHLAPNVRPSIDLEDLGPAQDILANVMTQIRRRQFGGLDGLNSMASVSPSPTSISFGRMITFLSQFYGGTKGVLGVDVGSSSTIMAAALGNKLYLNVYPFGQGSGITQVMQLSRPNDIAQWLPMHVPVDVVQDYLAQKALYPASVPMNTETLAIEQALARQVLHLSMQQTQARWPELPTTFEPIMAAGGVLNRAPLPSQSLLMLLDGLQPSGITILVLDQNGLLPSLGAIAKINSILPVQVLESGAFLNLGTVISPVCDAHFGTPILRVRLELGESNNPVIEVRQGSIYVLPLRAGQSANIHFQALRHVEIMPGRAREIESFKIIGGSCGAIIDARGRPIVLPPDASRRRDLIKKWNMALSA